MLPGGFIQLPCDGQTAQPLEFSDGIDHDFIHPAGNLRGTDAGIPLGNLTEHTLGNFQHGALIAPGKGEGVRISVPDGLGRGQRQIGRAHV